MKMKTSALRRITAVMLAVIMCAAMFNVYAFADYGTFRGSITSSDSDISTAGISIDVYGSRLRYSQNGLNRYEHYFYRTVTTDKNGRFSFTSPTKKVLLKVDLSTLPNSAGISEETVLAADSCSLTLSRVSRISIIPSTDGTQYRVSLTDRTGSPVFAKQTVSESSYASFYDITYEKINSVVISRKVTVSAAGLRKSRTFDLDMSSCTVSGKLARLLQYEIIDEEQRQRIISDYSADTEVPIDERPAYVDEKYFTAGNFMLHYDNGEEHAAEYEMILNDIIYTYFVRYGFEEPYHELVSGSSSKREKYYHIYLVSPGAIRVNSEVAPRNTVGRLKKIDRSDVTKGGYIVMDPSDDLDKFKKNLSHEIFHGVIYKYMDKTPASWFEEAFANYGAMLCMNGSIPSLNTQIGYFLKSTKYSLSDISSYKSRQYGEVLLPLYIHQKMGGVKTIKNILYAYKNSVNAYTAISTGLKKTNSSYTFAKAFAGFADYNAYTAFYKVPDSSASTASVGIGKNASLSVLCSFDSADVFESPAYTLPANSASYLEFRAPSSDSRTLTLTISTSAGVKNASYNLIVKGKKVRIPARGTASDLMTFELTDFSSSGSKSAVLCAVNNSTSSKVSTGFTVFASVSD